MSKTTGRKSEVDRLWAKLAAASKAGDWTAWEHIADEIERVTGRDPR